MYYDIGGFLMKSLSLSLTLATPEKVSPSLPVILATAPPGATFPYKI